jgi:hypothetical protein
VEVHRQLFEEAIEALALAQARMKQYYNNGRKDIRFEKGDEV